MKFYTHIFAALFCAFFPILVFSQVIAYEQAQQDSFLYQTYQNRYCYNYETALSYAKKAIMQYENEQSPLLAEAYNCAAITAYNLGKGQDSEMYHKKAIALYAAQEPKQKWNNYFALRSQQELYKKYQLKDSIDIINKKLIALLEQKAEVAYETEVNMLIAAFLQDYYFSVQEFDLVLMFINKAFELSKTLKNQNRFIIKNTQLRYYQLNFMAQQNVADSERKTKLLLKELQAQKNVSPSLMMLAFKTEMLANMSISDSVGLFTCFANLKTFVKKTWGEQNIQMGYYYIDYAVVLKDMYMRRAEALVEIAKGMTLLEKSPDPRDKQNYILSCYNAGSMATEISQKKSDYDLAQTFFYRGLQMSIAADGEQITAKNLPDFANANTRCDDLNLTYRLLEALYYNRYYHFEDSWTADEQASLLLILDKLTQLHERKTAGLQNGANFETVAKEYKELQNNYCRFYLKGYEKNKSKTNLAQILIHAENSKGIATRRHLNQDKAFALAGVPDKVIADYKREKANLQNLEIQYSVLLKESRKEAAAQVQQRLVDKKISVQKQERDLQKNYPQYAQLMYNPPVKTLDEVQKNLDKRTAFLYYFDYYKTEMQLIICKDTAWVVDMELSHDHLQQTSQAAYDIVQNMSETNLTANQLLDSFAYYYRFWAKNVLADEAVLAAKNINQLIISPAFLTNTIPFELLLLSDKRKGEDYSDLDYLLKKYAVQYVNSATLWLENKQQAAKNSHNGKILAYAPTYQKGVKNEFRTGNLKLLRTNLSELTGTLKEIENLKSFYYGDYRAGVEANEALFRKDLEQSYTILHLATHGLWDEDNPDLSALALSESADTLEDNFLNAYELAQLQTSSQLVVLSACETAKGKQQNTDGVMSIARYLMYGGAPAVIATRWQVNDQATAFIMQNFYKYLYDGKTVKEAIRTAQLDYLSQAKGIAAHPFYWAAFTNIGNTDASVYLASKDWAMKYYLIGTLALSVIFGLGWWKWGKRAE